MALVEREGADVALRTQADLLSLSRASLYSRPRRPSAEAVALKHRIDALYTQYPFYGSRRITAQLRREGRDVNRKAVQRHMREMGIAGIGPGPNLSRRAHGEQVSPYLLRGITSSYPNHVWGIDVTSSRLRSSWRYLVAVLDGFSRYVVSWELDDTRHLSFVLTAVKRALAQARPLIWNSDQERPGATRSDQERPGATRSDQERPGATRAATSRAHRIGSCCSPPTCRSAGMAGRTKGRALDTVFLERLWRCVKYEEVDPKEYASPWEARRSLTGYLAFYHHERPHQALAYRTPGEVYAQAIREDG